jgi:hypothetical protein
MLQSIRKILGVGLALGFVLNVFGWLGNVFLLGPMWNEAFTSVPTTPWRETPWRDLVSFLPDFIYGVAVSWLYVRLAAIYGPSFATALRTCMLVFVVGALTTYLGIANSGLLPWRISIATTVLALVTFIPGAWLTERLFRSNFHAP